MCGIAGIINPQSLTSNEVGSSLLKHRLQQMTTSIQHRGPDGTRCWTDTSGVAGFGHCRLAIIDLSDAAGQPLTPRLTPALSIPIAIGREGEGRYTIIHNGEIHNYIELREELIKKGYSFHTSSDTEVIVAAYDHYQDE